MPRDHARSVRGMDPRGSAICVPEFHYTYSLSLLPSRSRTPSYIVRSRPTQIPTTNLSDMSLPRHSYDPRRVCLLPLPPMPRFIRSNKRSFGIYASGALFSLAWWIFFDALLLSSIRSREPAHTGDPETEPPWLAPPVKMSFADWVPGLLATLGMIVVNLIDKSVLAEAGGFGAVGGFGGGGGAWGGDAIQWRARLFLFVGFALLAGGLAGSVTVLTIKYLIANLPEGYDYYGFANVIQNASIMLSTVLLWIAQSTESDYEYNLTL